MFLDRKAPAFINADTWSTALTMVLTNRLAADYIDNTDRRARETARYDAMISTLRVRPIAHDGSDRCPVFPGTAVYIRHKLNDVILLSRQPERLTWSDVISWVPIMEST